MKKRIASMLAATVMLFSVIALPASAQTDWLGNSDLTTAKVREIADADTLTESQIAEINNHYSEYEIMQGISKTLIEDYAARINPDNPPHCAVCAGFDDLWLHYINDVYRRLGYDGSNYDIQRGYGKISSKRFSIILPVNKSCGLYANEANPSFIIICNTRSSSYMIPVFCIRLINPLIDFSFLNGIPPFRIHVKKLLFFTVNGHDLSSYSVIFFSRSIPLHSSDLHIRKSYPFTTFPLGSVISPITAFNFPSSISLRSFRLLNGLDIFGPFL